MSKEAASHYADITSAGLVLDCKQLFSDIGQLRAW